MSVLDKIRDVLRGAKRLASEDLARSIAELEAQIPGMRAKIGEFERERARILVEAGDKELADIEAKLGAAGRDLDRGQALLAELQRREGEARENEAAAAIAAERASIEAEVQAIVKQKQGERLKLEAQLRAMVLAEKASDERVRAFNDRAYQEGHAALMAGKMAEIPAPIKYANELIPEPDQVPWPQFRVVWPHGTL
jgi:hypothetical protein